MSLLRNVVWRCGGRVPVDKTRPRGVLEESEDKVYARERFLVLS